MGLKKVFIFFILFIRQISTTAQTEVLSQTLSVSFKNETLLEVLTQITNKTGVNFTYSSDNINVQQKISLQENYVTLNSILNKLSEEANVKWLLVGNQIALKAKEKLTYKICGKIIDSITQQAVQYATLYIKGENAFETTDFDGKFCLLKHAEGDYTLIAKSFGYKQLEKEILVKNNASYLSLELVPHTIELGETIVSSDKIIENTSVSETQITETQLEAAKGLSNDPMKAITSVPGVLATVDFFGPNDIHIRGGEGNENLFLLDNIRLPFPFYFIGQSVINPDMIEKTELLTGGFNPNYGNAMSSVFNFSTKTGSMEKYSGNVDLSFFNSSALVQGPIIKNKLSGIIGFRQSNIGFLLRALGFKSNMNDLNSKFTFIINEKNKLNFTSLFVTDKLDFSLKENELKNLKAFDKINAQCLQLQSVISSKAYNKLSVLYSSINVQASTLDASYGLNNAIYSLRNDYTYYPTSTSKLKAGIEFNVVAEKALARDIYRSTDISILDTITLFKERKSNAINYQSAAYLFYEGKVSARVNYILGGRFDYSYLNGAFDISPRLTLAYNASHSTILSVAWGLFNQSPDMYSMLQNNNLSSNKCIQYILSVKQILYKDLKLKLEGYYKDYKNQVIFDTAWKYTNNGYGYAKGIEIVAQKDKGRLNGWLSYSYAISERKRNLQDRVYPSYYDQRHAYNAQLTFSAREKKRRWFVPTSYSFQFKYATGSPYTPIVGVDSTAGKLQLLTGSINSVRNADYQNLNAKIQWQRIFGKKQNHIVKYYIDLWNIYSSKNLVERVYTLTKTGTYTVTNRFTTPFLFSIGIKLIFNKL
ncbi:MAG: TonB-dependent receptor [Bacteroidota bacterium]|nr:TonB-dependent receptor [Bacteroidota bacterium]